MTWAHLTDQEKAIIKGDAIDLAVSLVLALALWAVAAGAFSTLLRLG